MKDKLKILILSLLMISACASEHNWIDELPKPWLIDENKLKDILSQINENCPEFDERLKAVTLWRVGTPYSEFKLGEEAAPDDDPIFRLDVSDCTVHVLTSLALAQSNDWQDARRNMIKIHYKSNKDGDHIPIYESRWHFTSDRILHNPSTLNITSELLPINKLITAEVILNEKSNNEHLLDIDYTEKVKLAYIPNSEINSELLIKLPDVCGVAFIKESYINNGLLVAHEGVLIDNNKLVHASSEYGKTVNVNFLEYYFKDGNPRFDGIMIYKFIPLN